MKNKIIKIIIPIIIITASNLAYSQDIINSEIKLNKEKMQVVKKLNKPTKIWIDGKWKIQSDGSRVWQKGHWSFSEKTFQQKSQMLRNQTLIKGKV